MVSNSKLMLVPGPFLLRGVTGMEISVSDANFGQMLIVNVTPT